MPKVTEGKVISLKKKTTVYATDKHKYAKPGDALEMHPELAKTLTERGWVTAKAPKADKDK